ncbi:zinc finger protein 8-like [Osmerus eperlanus]|uniref:zinc finger protein 8-like n=1 Tax=Osmerus eperlanus TaxID=29151 RepID=UPI002E0FCDD6
MSTCRPTTFQTQLTAIMEVLTKAAVAEISRLVDDRCTVLHLEVSRHQNENDILKGKLLKVESELKSERTRRSTVADTYVEKVGGPPDWRANQRPDEDPAFGAGVSMKPFTVHSEPADIDTTKSLMIKEERPDEELWTNNTHSDGLQLPGSILYHDVLEEFQIENQHFEDELHTQQSHSKEPNKHCEKPRYSTEDSNSSSTGHNGVETNVFVVKLEKEEELSEFLLDACQHSTGKQNPTGIGFAMDERDSQLWASIVQENPNIDADFPTFSNVADQYSQTFSDCSEAAPFSASKESSGLSQSTPQSPCKVMASNVHLKDKLAPQFMSTFHCMPQRSQRNDHISLTDQQMLEKSTASHSGMTFPTSNQLGISHHTKNNFAAARRDKFTSQRGKTFSRSPYIKIHQQVIPGHESLSCDICGKRFASLAHLVQHNRVHTGERPFGCATCGKRFSQKGSLKAHQRIHSGERPFCCAQCGKTFTLKHHLKRHRLIHTTEMTERGLQLPVEKDSLIPWRG